MDLKRLILLAAICLTAGTMLPAPVQAGTAGDLKEVEELLEEEEPEEVEEGTDETDEAVPALASASSSDYYYARLSGDEQLIYKALLTYAKSPSDYILANTYTCTASSAKDAYAQDPITSSERLTAAQALIFDHPEYYWIDNISTKHGGTKSGDKYTVKTYVKLTDGGFDGYESKLTAMDSAIDNVLDRVDFEQSPAAIAFQIHEVLRKDLSYDWDAASGSGFDLAHTAYGALVQKEAVCDGYSKAYMMCLKRAGINSVVVAGTGHAWNSIEHPDAWYETDLTWDDTGDDPYTFYGMTSSEMSQMGSDHEKNMDLTGRYAPSASGRRYTGYYMSFFGRSFEGKGPTGGTDSLYTAVPSDREWSLDIENRSSVWESAADASGLTVASQMSKDRALQIKRASDSQSGTFPVTLAVRYDNGAESVFRYSLKLDSLQAVSINASEISIYFIDDDYASDLSIPSGLPASFQLKVSGYTGTVTYKILSGATYFVVDKKGLVTAADYGDFHTPGTGVIRVTAGSDTFDVKVHVVDYVEKYYEDFITGFIKKNVKSGMSDYQKAELIMKYIASLDYDGTHHSAQTMYLYQCGSCWASTDMIMDYLERLGIEADIRDASSDQGAGGGHINVLAILDGKSYMLDGGYTGKAPRYYMMKKTDKAAIVTILSDNIELKVGESANLDVKLTPEGSTDTITWVSSDPSIATVKDGKVTAVSEGLCGITANSEYTYDIINVSVVSKGQTPTYEAQNGWSKNSSGGKVYYRNGALLKGLQTIDGSVYYFDGNGVMKTGMVTVSGSRMYFETDGKRVSGWFTYSGSKYYAPSGTILTGWQTVSGSKYYFAYDGKMSVDWQTISGSKYYFGTDGKLRTGWQTISGSKYYFSSDGKMASGLQTISGAKYLFGSDGKMLTGWQTVSGSKYYFGTDGKMLTNWQTISGGRFYLGTDGKMRTLWQTISGSRYYFGTDGRMRTLWQTIDGSRYYFGTDGKMVTGKKTIDGMSYTFGSDGKLLQTGWQTVGGYKYYMDSSGRAVTGWQTIEGARYHFAADGRMDTGFRTIDGSVCYFSSDGKMRSGWQDIGGSRYYFGTDGQMAKNWQAIDGKTCFFGTDGKLRTHWQTINGFKYYFGTDGVQATGFRTIDGKRYYFFPRTQNNKYKGTMAKNWFSDMDFPSDSYYAGSDGAIRTGWQTINGFRYYMGADGRISKGKVRIGGSLYYFWPRTQNNRYRGTMAKGWFSDMDEAGVSYYAGKDGKLRTGWQTINGFRYYMASNGAISKGHVTIGGKPYYFWPSTDAAKKHYKGTMAKGWISDKGTYYGGEGGLVTGLKTVNGFYYYFGPDGRQMTGWHSVSGNTYYFWPKTEKGHYKGTAATLWPTIDGKKYYTGRDGRVRYGWQAINGYRYYMGADGVIRTGFTEIDGTVYYFYTESRGGHYRGTMAAGAFTADGQAHRADASGAVLY